jgi:hypothetical protein
VALSHQEQQDLVLAGLEPAVESAWSLLNVKDLRGTLDHFSAALSALVHHFGRASASAAAKEYATKRVEAGIPGTFRPAHATSAGLEQVTAEVNDATKSLWNADVRSGASSARLIVDDALTNVQGVATRLVLNTSRETLLDAVQKDRKARGWARVPEAGACSFCLLLATRGAVYKTQQTGEFAAHDHCRCHVDPLFASHYEPTAQVREAQALYKASTKGLSGSEARNAFRRAVDESRSTP